MKRSAVNVDDPLIARATSRAIKYREEFLRQADHLRSDTEVTKRFDAQLCPVCYYLRSNRIGGCAITWQPCGACGTEQSYANTCTDLLCMPCAKSKRVCKRCAADLELNLQRKLIAPAESRSA